MLKQLREKAGVSPEAARKAIGVSPNTLWRLETAQSVRLYPPMIERLCEVYGASEEVTQTLLGLIEEAKKPGWWHAYGDTIPKDFDLFLGLEEAAQRVVVFYMNGIPGLLQTDEYRRAMAWVLHPNKATEEIEQRIERNAKRRERLSDPKKFSLLAILSEAALRHRVGEPGIMIDQLQRLLEAGRLPNVSIRVIPLAVVGHLGMLVGNFTLLEFPRNKTEWLTEPPVVYVEGYTGALYLDKESDVRQYREACPLLERAALDEDASRELILEIVEEYRSELGSDTGEVVQE
ncbi:helix-turn-helix domain-containing protein [Nocardia terpenica]|uniref:helix-turn-helix domain-containing protein n=1 Tax=Nocardia terpenica TaxID=455432 RepID=UPI0018933B83|nr:helix-turn-helix transcriptional regulator [Nocardia terpenica]MBF6063686.1 helix-turn-helix domain-containing protein [Nocardia terpenica]MBF6107062.1 helix-turn-helix domain-containing protein [Nocardia terpenica]MBF6114235.1 helix-turn-helix domain-containing protein [Nocardia terpenica]MBF6121678.1 helix-turn-helix domain-containing protein [Nocardia terpenica]MBF6154093.1 helix-turn-helix domain-containing protein [Nocardia terpenica]